MKYSLFPAFLCIGFGFVNGQTGRPNNIVVTNDDGWATAQIRAQFEALEAAGFNLVLSCPAINRSGTGSSTAPPTTLTAPCEFNTCATGSPPEGSDPEDPRLNYVNSFPVDSVRFGIQTLSPQFFWGLPDFVVSGPNVGTNLGPNINGSGTVGAACEAALEGIPSAAFSASTASQISFTTLNTDPNSALSISARIYADLTTTFTTTLLAAGRPILPPGISVNVNFSPTPNCMSVGAFRFVPTRIAANDNVIDAPVCATEHLPAERGVVTGPGCFVSVSVMNAASKGDVDAATQAIVFEKLSPILTCF